MNKQGINDFAISHTFLLSSINFMTDSMASTTSKIIRFDGLETVLLRIRKQQQFEEHGQQPSFKMVMWPY